jgi:hypothetical protein
MPPKQEEKEKPLPIPLDDPLEDPGCCSRPRFILADTVAKTGANTPQTVEKESITPPVIQLQEMESSFDGSLPSTIKEILGKLKDNTANVFFEFCKTAESQMLMGTSSLIEQARQAQMADNKDKMFTIPGIDLTVVLMAGKGDMLRAWDRKNNIGAIMYAQGKQVWNALYLGYTPSGSLYHAEEKAIRADEFSSSDWKYVINLGERILERKRIR